MNPIINYIKGNATDIYDLISGKSIRDCDRLAKSLTNQLERNEKEAKEWYNTLKKIDKHLDNYLR